MRLYLLSPINGDWKVYRATSFPSATLMQLLANVHYGCPIIIQRSKTSAVRRCHPLSRLLRTGWSTTLVIQELMDGSDGEDKWGMVDVIQLLTLVIGSHNLFISFPWCSFHSVVFISFRHVHFIPLYLITCTFLLLRLLSDLVISQRQRVLYKYTAHSSVSLIHLKINTFSF